MASEISLSRSEFRPYLRDSSPWRYAYDQIRNAQNKAIVEANAAEKKLKEEASVAQQNAD